MRMIQKKPVEYNPLPGILPPIAQKIFRGSNRLDPFTIEPDFATETKNLTSRGYPALSVRPGITQLGSAFGARVLGLGTWKDTELHAVANGGWYKWNGSTWGSALASSLSAAANWSFCNFKGGFSDFNLIGANGTDAIKKYDGSTVSSLANAPSGGNYVDAHDNRVYCAVKNIVRCSALALAEDWSDTDPYVGSGTIRINDASGKDINGLKAGAEHLLAFFPRATYELYGTGPDDFKMINIATDIGLLSDQCVTVVSGVHYWADSNGIYRYAGGGRPRRDFSLVVQAYLDGMNASIRSKCCAGTDGKRFYFSMPSGAATDPNITLEYDPEYSGIWNVWEDVSPLNYANAGDIMYIAESNGKVHQFANSTNDNGTAISWKWVSVPFGSRILAQSIRWYNMWLIADVPVGSTCNVYLSKLDKGDTDWTLANSVTAATGLQKQRIIIPVDTIANANWVRVKFEGTGPVTIHEFDRQQREMPLR